MSGIFNSMNTATKGLMAQQTSLHTTGHNIANINTEGFTRQRVDMKADRAHNLNGIGQIGTGVKMEAVVRMTSDHISKQIRNENSTLNRFTEKSGVIDALEVIFNEPSDTGLNFNIAEMFESFNALSNNPESLNFKTVVVEKLKTLTETLKQMGNQIEGLKTETHDAIDKNILDFNTKVEGLNSLNKQIFNVSIRGQIPNDLLDQRDLMLKELSSTGEVDLDFDKYGRVEIKIDSNETDGDGKVIKKDILTYEGQQNYLAYDKADESKVSATREIKLYDNKTKAEKREDPISNIDVKNGKIKGNIDAVEVIQEASGNLDKMANSLAQSINKTHGKLKDKDKQDLGDIFIFDKGKIDAKSIGINKSLKEENGLLQAGKEGSEQGDGSLALELSQIRNKKTSLDTDGNIKDDSSGTTISGSYRDMVIKVGISKQHSDNMVANQNVLTQQLENRRESISGVSINDEIANVIKFQKAYEANAKVLSVLTDMLDVLINRTGV